MCYFDFHHHHLGVRDGIFNASLENTPHEMLISLGIHPMEIPPNWEEAFDKIKEKAQLANCVAIGECGLDVRSNASTMLQKEVFHAHLEWANTLGKPMIIHCVKQYDALIPFRKKAKVPMVIHGFNKNKNLAMDLVRHGFLLSFGTQLTHSSSLQETLKAMPEDAFFLETDAKDIPISQVYTTAAQVLGKSEQWMKDRIKENLINLGIHDKLVREK